MQHAADRVDIRVNESESEALHIIPAEYEHLISHLHEFTEEYMHALFEGVGEILTWKAHAM